MTSTRAAFIQYIPEDFLNRYFIASLVLSTLFIMLGSFIGMFLESITFVLLIYFLYLLIVIIINTQGLWINKLLLQNDINVKDTPLYCIECKDTTRHIDNQCRDCGRFK